MEPHKGPPHQRFREDKKDGPLALAGEQDGRELPVTQCQHSISDPTCSARCTLGQREACPSIRRSSLRLQSPLTCLHFRRGRKTRKVPAQEGGHTLKAGSESELMDCKAPCSLLTAHQQASLLEGGAGPLRGCGPRSYSAWYSNGWTPGTCDQDPGTAQLKVCILVQTEDSNI